MSDSRDDEALREEVARFFREEVPRRWNERLEAQLAAAAEDEASLRIDTSIGVSVADGRLGAFHLNVEGGRLSTSEQALRSVPLSVGFDEAGFRRISRDSGGDALAFLGLLAGAGEAFRLTRGQLDAISELDGSLHLVVSGTEPFRMTFRFGTGSAARADIELAAEAYRAMQAGELDLQRAFVDGKMRVEGDLELAMRAALIAFTPD